jgi:hypothetical protein
MSLKIQMFWRLMQMALKFRSKLEKECYEALGKEWKYEPCRIAYTIRKNYTPDFVKGKYHIEVKGFFRSGDRQKYKSIAEQMRFEGKELIFLMPRPDSKVAKGNKITYRKWCEKYDIRIFSTKEIKELKKWTKIT